LIHVENNVVHVHVPATVMTLTCNLNNVVIANDLCSPTTRWHERAALQTSKCRQR